MRHVVRTLICATALFSLQASGQKFTQEMVDEVSADSLMATIVRLQNFGTRYEFSPQRDSAASFLVNEFSRLGLSVHSDWYSFGTITLYDVPANKAGIPFTAGGSGAILASTDAGEHWTRVGSNSALALYGIAFADAQTGCAVGPYGMVLRTTDGGSTWNGISSGATAHLYDIGFAADTLGIMVGAGGKIFRSTDAGGQWLTVTSGITAPLRCVRFLDPSNIWVAGDAGTLLHSTNGGTTWISSSLGTFNALYAVVFSSASKGWAVGDGPVILTTSDGGANWTNAPLPPSANRTLRGICFQDSLQGWIVDYYGKIFRTVDGGANWVVAYDHMSGDWGPYFMNINLLPGAQLFACGSQGVLLASSNGGETWTSRTEGLPDSLLHRSRNIVASLPGIQDDLSECVIVAHYDSYNQDVHPMRAAPGANDNASGTSALLEAARIARKYAFHVELKFVAVSGEELGMYGSNHYARQALKEGRPIIGVVNGDMIGYPISPDTTRLVISTYLTPNRLIDSALAANQRYGLGLTLVPLVDSTGASDFGPFAIMGYDALDIAEGTPAEIWGGADPYYHSSADIASNMSPGLVRRGAQLMLAVGVNLAGAGWKINDIRVESPGLPARFALEQNYPNPFNPRTGIRYTVPTLSGRASGVSDVKITVYDMLGREVAVLVNEQMLPGTYQVTFDGSGLASGMYIYRLSAGALVESRTMLLLK